MKNTKKAQKVTTDKINESPFTFSPTINRLIHALAQHEKRIEALEKKLNIGICDHCYCRATHRSSVSFLTNETFGQYECCRCEDSFESRPDADNK